MLIGAFAIAAIFVDMAVESSSTSVSTMNNTRVSVETVCSEMYGPEVVIEVANEGDEAMNVSPEHLPWSEGGAHILFFSGDSDIEIINWVSHVHGHRTIQIEPKKSLHGTVKIWDRIEPKSVTGRRTLSWRYGTLHQGTIVVDFSRCPVRWDGKQIKSANS